jgi:hypothetical protein
MKEAEAGITAVLGSDVGLVSSRDVSENEQQECQIRADEQTESKGHCARSCRSFDMVRASRQPRHSKLSSSGCPANAGTLRTQRIGCTHWGHLGRRSDMPEQRPQKPSAGYSGIVPMDYNDGLRVRKSPLGRRKLGTLSSLGEAPVNGASGSFSHRVG